MAIEVLCSFFCGPKQGHCSGRSTWGALPLCSAVLLLLAAGFLVSGCGVSMGTPVSAAADKITPTISWATPANITSGTALTSSQLNASASVAGTFVYTPAAGTVPPVGTITLQTSFTPSDTSKYNSASKSVSLVVDQLPAPRATPDLTWPTPAAITYGTKLSSKQLDATASVDGTFAYSPKAGTMPPVGTDTLSVTFTPSDTADYNTASRTVSLIVHQPPTAKSKPSLTWPTPAAIVSGTALSSRQLDATASVPGTFDYSPGPGTVPAVGTDTLTVTFTPSDTANYDTANKSVSLVVNKKTDSRSTPSITWPTPAAITYGTPLSSKQLDATASVAGTFAYSPAAGSVPPAGDDVLVATFTPTNSSKYNTTSASVTLVVNQKSKSTPTITWPTPSAITYGTALSSKQLDASASVAGSFAYSPAAGTVPAVGTDTLSVTFTPTDTTSYNTATASVSLVVNKATTSKSTPTITWATPSAIAYGTALSSKQLDASASVAGSFAYSPAAGTVPAVGTDTLNVTFTPTDTTSYNTATASVSLVVNKATTSKTTPTITWPTPSAITYGTALSSKQLDASASVAGSFAYSPAAGTIPAAGTDMLSVTFTPTDTTSYNTATGSVALVVNSGSPSASGTPLNDCADLTKSGTYYLAQDVSSSGTCFFIDADNITLNLNGHTITYGTGGGSQGTPGILLADTWYTAPGYTLARTGSTDSHAGFVLYGGTITEASNAAIQSRGIWVGQSSDINPAPVIHDVVINTYTQDAEPIFGTVSDSGWQIYNNTLNWACKSTYPATGKVCDSSRYSLLGYALWIADDPDSPGVVPDQIYNNKIIAAPQGGVFDNHQNAHITNNDITFNSYFSNDYCVATVSGDGQIISENNCHPTNGRGIDDEAANVQITNNTITAVELPQNSEYGGCENAGTDGIRVRDNAYQGNPSAPSHVTVSGNTVTVSASHCQANGLRLTNLTGGDSVTIANNIVTSTGTGSQPDYAISFDEDDQAPLTFTTNTFKSVHAFVEVDWDGANQSINNGQTWIGTPTYFVDNENGYHDQSEGGPTFSQALTIDTSGSGTVHCGNYAAGPVIVGSTSVVCN
ncbi:MAG TPA: hypothetical protein VFW25_02305 [Silvibacterium sp.]|nr:hypothetical protein [Silvibacterium sp.]